MSEAIDTIDKKGKDGVVEFVKKTRAELDKTTFPGRDEVQKTTIIVVISVIFFAIYLWGMDHFWVYVLDALNWVVNWLVGL